ncbi:MAG: DUF5110 domain-containing protein [Chitinivibrionales bacterium]|nr:DUF5110 domain-containing protein [Chitinivibrionales bacterium]
METNDIVPTAILYTKRRITMKRCSVIAFLMIFSLAGLIVGQESVQSWQEESDGIILSLSSGKNLKLEVFGENIIRVVYTAQSTIPPAQGHLIVTGPSTGGGWNTEETSNDVSLTTGDITASVDKSTGVVRFASGGTVVLAEKSGSRSLGSRNAEIEFESPSDEGIYGFGQWRNGSMNQRDEDISMVQYQTEEPIPVFLSTRGYGVLLHTYSKMNKTAPLKFSIDYTPDQALDYYFMYGPSFDRIVGAYRTLTGSAPLFGKYAYGFWQSKNRYQDQARLLDALREYRSREIPVDNIVCDFYYWTPMMSAPDGLGSFEFDPSNWPDPEGMIDTIHDLGAKFKISIWPHFSRNCGNHYTQMDNNGYIVNCNLRGCVYDPIDEDAGALYWSFLNDHLFSKGVDAWWCDGVEPEYGWSGTTAEGPVDKFYNSYPLFHSRNIYNGQRTVTSEKRVYMLLRSSFAGMQRYAGAVWSGDIHPRWSVLKEQVPGGLNYCVSGLPYWTTDIGGYFDSRSWQTAGYRELWTRWFQYGTFCPIFRVHGQLPTEQWIFGDATMAITAEFTKLRYRLIPYIYSMAWMVTDKDYTIMRPLVFDYMQDNNTYDISDQFMFGDIMVCPIVDSGVVERSVYLPSGTNWVDFWTGETQSGGRTITAQAPIERIPLYVREGAVIPMGPGIQWTTEKPADPIELRIYPGANGSVTLYEDEWDNYNYETGSYAEIPITWDESSQKVTIGSRSGTFPGMLQERTFNIVWVAPDHGIARDTTSADATVTYTGTAVSIDRSGQTISANTHLDRSRISLKYAFGERMLRIDGIPVKGMHLRIVDPAGRIRKRASLDGRRAVPLDLLPRGYYFTELCSGTTCIVRTKIIVQ